MLPTLLVDSINEVLVVQLDNFAQTRFYLVIELYKICILNDDLLQSMSNVKYYLHPSFLFNSLN